MAIIYHEYLHPQIVKVLSPCLSSYKYKSKIWINILAFSILQTKKKKKSWAQTMWSINS